jgi:hypothetical protein
MKPATAFGIVIAKKLACGMNFILKQRRRESIA